MAGKDYTASPADSPDTQESEQAEPQKKKKAGGRSKGDAPMMRVCYICGHQFGSSSLSIHQPQCLKKWVARNDLLPPEERRPQPVAPEILSGGGGGSGGGGDGGGEASVAQMNAAAEKAHEGNLAPCPHCGRTFNPERLPIHLKSCGGKHGTSKRVKTTHEIEALSIFRKIDRNSNGVLDPSELHHRLADFGLCDVEIHHVSLHTSQQCSAESDCSTSYT